MPTMTSSLCPPGVVAPAPMPTGGAPPVGPGEMPPTSPGHPGGVAPGEGHPAPPVEGIAQPTGGAPISPENPSVPISSADRKNAAGGLAALALAALGLAL